MIMPHARMAGVAALLAIAGAATAQPLVTLFSEDFESFPLTVNQEENNLTGNPGCFVEAFLGDGVLCGQPNANLQCGDPPVPATIDCGPFSNVPFDGLWEFNGWEQEFGYDFDPNDSITPATVGVGTAEWQGWSIADVTFWQNADGQQRSNFTRASGAAAIADPDEWDDYDPLGIDPDSTGVFNARLTSPLVSLAGVNENSVVVSFDSSWRDEDTQSARLSVSFDGGPFTPVFTWSSDSSSPDFKDDAVNERLNVAISNPSGATNMRVQWEMFNATNDWWWAIDNISVLGQGGTPTQAPGAFDFNPATFYETTRPEFTWTLSPDATSYVVDIANDAAFTDIVISESTTALSFVPPAGELQSGVYFVRVTATNAIGTFVREGTIGIDNPEPADLTGDGFLTGADFFRFLTLFENGC